MSRITRLLLTLLLVVLAIPATAQRDRNNEIGFVPGRLYDTSDVDNVNLFNGNLSVSIPIGPAYQVGPAFSYRFMLTFNSKAVSEETWPCEDHTCVKQHPNLGSNAGLGWRLSMGQLLAPTGYSESSLYRGDFYIYESPSGAEYKFRTAGEEGPAILLSDEGPDEPLPRLRMRKIHSGLREIDFPNGEVHAFVKTKSTGGTPRVAIWRLSTIRDRLSGSPHQVSFTYLPATGEPKTACLINDSAGRSHRIDYEVFPAMSSGFSVGAQATKVKLAGLGNEYDLVLKKSGDLGCGQAGGGPAVLTQLVQPDGSTYNFNEGRCYGRLDSFNLPTGGTVSYEYAAWDTGGPDQCFYATHTEFGGVIKRTIDDGTGNPRVWQYKQQKGAAVEMTFPNSNPCNWSPPGMPSPNPSWWSRTSVIPPPDREGKYTRTDYYFNAMANMLVGEIVPKFPAEDIGGGQYGAPGTIAIAPADDAKKIVVPYVDDVYAARAPRPLVSQMYENCTSAGDCTNGTLLRSVYEELSRPEPHSSETLIHDETCAKGGTCYTLVERSDPDLEFVQGYPKVPIHHYRTEKVTSNIGVPATGALEERTAFTNHRIWTFADLADDEIWFNTSLSDKTQVTEGGQVVSTEERCYDLGTAFLRRHRVWANASAGSTDILKIYEPTSDGKWLVASETSHGGWTSSLSSTDTCGLTPATTDFKIVHTYATTDGSTNGSRTPFVIKSEFVDPATNASLGFLQLDRTVNVLTGAVTSSRDSAGSETKFNFDANTGRLMSVLQPGGPLTSFEYFNATGTGAHFRASVFVRRHEGPTASSTLLTEDRYHYDLLGRLIQSRRRMPDNTPGGTWSVVETRFDLLGRNDSQTVPVAASSDVYAALPSTTPQTKTKFDSLSRPYEMKLPDGSISETEYAGITKRWRSHTVATSANSADWKKVWTREELDWQGQLVAVVENSPAKGSNQNVTTVNGADVLTTSYTYDAGGHLTRVDSGVQVRTFAYDLAGRLLSEDHPESDSVTYEYDSAGNLTKRVQSGGATIKFDFDKAARLKTVTHEGVGAVKEFTFGTGTTDTDRSLGKIRTATRHNRLAVLGDVPVTETFTYGGRGGRVSKKVTTAGAESFTDEYTYDPLGNVETTTYPTCTGCAPPPARTVKNTFSRDYLDKVEQKEGAATTFSPVASAFTYHPNGLLLSVSHHNANGAVGPIQTQTVDPSNGLPRPASIAVSGYCDFSIGTQPEPKTYTAGQPRELKVVAAGATSYQWFAGSETTPNPTLDGQGTDTIHPPFATQTYWVRVGNGTCTVDSRVVLVTAGTGCNLIQTQPVDTTINSGQRASFGLALTGTATVTWYQGSVGTTTNEVGSGLSFTTPQPLTATTLYWARVTGTCVQDSVQVSAIVQSCAATPTVIPSAAMVLESTPFQLTTQAYPNATYKWYRDTETTPFATTSVPALEIAGITSYTDYVVEVSDNACNSIPVKSPAVRVNVCRKPSQRDITASVINETSIRLSILDSLDGTTYEWFQGTSYADTSVSLGTATSVVVGTDPQSYWVRMTRTCGSLRAVADTPIHTVSEGCTLPRIFVQPQSQSVLLPAVGANVSMTTKVIAGERGPFTYQWFDAAGFLLQYETSDSYTWTHTGSNAERNYAQKRVYVVVYGCGTSIRSDTVTLTASPTPQKIYAYDPGASLHGSYAANLFVRMDPEPSPVHEYTYEWFEDDGTDDGKKLSATGADIYVQPNTSGVYWVKITGTHEANPDPNGNVGTYEETTVSKKMNVYQYGTCDLPAVKVKTDGATSGSSVVFTAFNGWNNADYQWYRGLSGDTRDTIDGDPQHPERLTVSASTISPYWVRVSRECGGFTDSKTLYFSRGTCVPVIMNQNIASVDVAHGGSATLKAHAVNITSPGYKWYREGTGSSLGSQSEITFSNVVASGRYFVRVDNPGCGTFTDSFVALVRVATCPGMTPVWTTEFWTDKGMTAQLTASVAGATSFQWYEGEVGDHTHPIGGATSASFTTLPLTADKKYWVRAFGPSCHVDSPTITAKVCELPAISGSLHTDRYSTVTGQSHFLGVNATGTKLQYQWFVGNPGDETRPFGRDTDVALVRPTTTTVYWVKVSAACGVGGSAPRSITPPPTYKVSVCATITNPVAAKTIVMPGTSTTVSLTATGSELSFQWYRGNSGDYANPIPNSNSPSISTGVLNATTTFWCEVKSGICPRHSEQVTVEVCEIPNLYFTGSNPRKIEKSQYTVLSVNGVPPDVARSYVWYVGEKGDTSQPHSTQAAIGVSPQTTTTYWARVTFDDTGCTADSPSMKLDVCIPKIGAQPQPMRINANGTATMFVTADLPNVTYQWYAGQSGNTTTLVNGQTTNTLTVTPTVATSYWVRVMGSCGIWRDSDAAAVTICEPPSIFRQPSPMNVPKNFTASIDVGASGSDLTYQWYKGLKGDTSNPLAGRTSSVLSISLATTGDYWVRVSGACGSVDSNAAKISVPPTITTQPVGGTVMPGSIRTVTTAATGTELSYQWHKIVGSTITAIAGATGTSYTTPAINADTTYYCVIKSGNNQATTAEATFSVCQLPVLSWGTVDTQTTPGQYQILSINGAPTDTPVAYQWYRGAAGDTANPISSQPAIGVSPTTTTTYWVRVTLTDTGCWVDSTVRTINVCVQSITSQPAASTTIDKVTNPSAFARLTVATDLGGNTYQWFIGQPGVVTTPVSGATSATYDASPSTDTTYWVRVTGSCGVVNNSAAAQVIVCQPPAITSQPSNMISTSGSSRTLAVGATGTELSYQWYRGVSGVTTTPVGSNASSITVSQTTTTDYWVKVTGRCGSVSSTTAKISIPAGITTEPVGGPITSGTTRALSVVATGTQLSYQWYQRVGTSEVVIGGATASSYTTPPIVADATYFCRITSGMATRDSADAALTVCLPNTISMQNYTGVSGSAVTLYVSNPPPDESFEWYRGATGNTTALIGYSNAISVSPLETTQYWVRTKRAGCDADTPAVTVRICRPKINTQPVGGLIASGTTKTLSVAATGATPLTYQWYAGAQGVTTSPVAGATGATFTTPALTANATYWVRIFTPSAGCSTNYTDSTAATVTVCQPPTISQQPASMVIASTTTITLSVTAAGEGLTYQWYEGTAGVTTKPVGSGATSYSVKPGTTKSYWVRLTGTCGTLDSQVALISVLPTITTQPVPGAICNLGESATFSVAASGSGLTYQWYRKYTSQAWQIVPGATGTTAAIPIDQVPAYVYCAVKSGNATNSTDMVDVTVNPKPGLYNVTQAIYSTGSPYYKLTTHMPVEERELVTYKWYEGALGDTSKLLFNGEYPIATVQPVTRPKTYWVRVSFTDTGCYIDRAVTVP